MQPFQSPLTSVPAITAIATLTAACIAALVATVVAYVNAWSNRRIAIDTAHRAHRAQLAEVSLSAMRKLLTQVDELELASRRQDFARWCDLVSALSPMRSLRQDLPTSNDEVFAAAIRLFITRRANLSMWLRIATRDRDKPPFGMTDFVKYMTEAAQILEVAAESYVFTSRNSDGERPGC